MLNRRLARVVVQRESSMELYQGSMGLMELLRDCLTLLLELSEVALKLCAI
jgi:hypothetical protein